MIVSPKELNELVNMKVQEQSLEIERRILEKEQIDMENLAKTLRAYVDSQFADMSIKLKELDIRIRKVELAKMEDILAKIDSEIYIKKIKPSETTAVPCKPSQSTKERRRESSRRANRKPKPSS